MPYWLKGGIILGCIIGILLGGLFFSCRNSCSGFQCLDCLIFVPVSILIANLFSGNPGLSVSTLLIVFLLSNFVLGFLIGAIAGYIYKKIKEAKSH